METKNSIRVPQQPDFGKKHIKSKEDLKVGMKVRLHYGKAKPSDVTITELEEDKFNFKTELPRQKIGRTSAYYIDYGLEPHKNGWHNNQWVELLEDN